MENRKKYYLVTIKNISENKDVINDAINVYAEEYDGELVEILTNKKIQDSSLNYNPNIFDVRKFIEKGQSLFGICKIELDIETVSKFLLFITEFGKRQLISNVLELERLTKEEARSKYQELIEMEVKFKEEINKTRRK